MSNPDEAPGEATEIDWPYLEQMRGRLAELVPVTRSLGLRRVWAATIDYTPDHLPILGPGARRRTARWPGPTVASAGGHGMMWGPGVARAAADLVLTGTTDVVDVSRPRARPLRRARLSRLDPDPIALPFPERTTRMSDTTVPLTPYLTARRPRPSSRTGGPLDEATGPEMTTSGLTLWNDGDQEIGIWECTPGPSRWLLETHEFVHIVAAVG